MIADRCRERRHVVLHAGRGLVVREQNARECVRVVVAQALRERSGIETGTERRLDNLDLETVNRSDRREPPSEHTDRACKHFLSRREAVGDGRFETARTGASQYDDIAVRPEDRSQFARNSFEHRRELRAAVIDQRRSHCLEHSGCAHDRAGNQEPLRHLHVSVCRGGDHLCEAGQRLMPAAVSPGTHRTEQYAARLNPCTIRRRRILYQVEVGRRPTNFRQMRSDERIRLTAATAGGG